ncbi:MAG: hypothetical protein IPH75_00335 [bacterium]|nr:hypothetical protein [bacterium]
MSRSSRQQSSPSGQPSAGLFAKSNLQKGVYILLGLAVVYAIVMVVTNWWVCDDAFISFRYAKNLIDGHGLVYNLGEKVEGYSNFLWTLIIALGMRVGIDPVPLSLVLGGISFLAVVVATGLTSLRLFGGDGRQRIFLPVAALLLLLHHEMHVYTTSGLETMFTTALVMFGFLTLVTAKANRELLAAGFLLTLASLARPDGLLFAVMGGVFLLVTERKLRPLIWYGLPVALLYLPYFIWRYSYYGFLFPNTYYAKSGDLSYWSQGWIYLWVYLKSYYLLFLVPLSVAVIALMRVQGSKVIESPLWRGFVLALLFVVPYLIYVMKVGGDFMFGRFWIVVTPLLLLLIEMSVRALVKRSDLAIGLTLLLAAMMLLRVDLYKAEPKAQISGIANEPAYYPPSHYETARMQGEKLRRYLEGLDVQVAFRGQHAMQVYYSEVPVAIEAATGLTDSYIAHLPLAKRGRPGHEKTAPLDYLNSRGVEFMLVGIAVPGSLADSLTQISFGGYSARILQYNGEVMEKLRQYPEVRFIDIPGFLDTWIPQLPYLPPDLAKNSYEFFQDFYFRSTPDPVRQARFSAAVGQKK